MNKQEIAKVAAELALDFYKKEQERQNKLKRDRRLRNTKLLLRNYRKFKIHCEENTQSLKVLQDPNSLEHINIDELVIESIIKNKERTAAMIAYVDRMIDIYRVMAERSSKPEDLRRFKIMHDYYIAEEIINAENIAACHFIDKRTVYRDINKACEALSSLIFGVDGIRMIV
ncbi:hypothetical protein [Paenibacillus senegalensis]|uniref:hypothetical protein n=1 Tax=Paenibacillus senegalensis TaxID=1465766 RepID=UPI00028952E6|nr:hypothetical protein [Paenibacillus senegalensis]